MNIEEVNGVMDLTVEELSTTQILFDVAKALLLTHDFVSKKT